MPRYPYLFDKVKHVHMIDGNPLMGTSTVIKDVLPPFLAKWGAQCAVDFTKSQIEKHMTATGAFPNGDYLNEILDKSVSAWYTTREKAAEKGTDMHDMLEKYVKHCISEHKGKPVLVSTTHAQVKDFATWAHSHVDVFISAECNTFSKELWVGGQVDCLARLNSGKLIVIDFKSSKETYFNHVVQAAGYSIQLEEQGYGKANGTDWQFLDGKIEVLAVIPFGSKLFTIDIFPNVEGFQRTFTHLVPVYGMLQSFKQRAKN